MSILDFKGNVEGGVVDCLENYKITESHKSQTFCGTSQNVICKDLQRKGAMSKQ